MRIQVLFLSLLCAIPVRAAAEDCRAAFSIPKLMKRLAAKKAPEGEPDDGGLRWELLAYYKWRAFASGDSGECAPMKALRFLTDVHDMTGGDVLCRDLYHRLSFVRGYVEYAPNLPQLCMENVVNEGARPDAEQLSRYRKSCDIIIRRDVPVEQLCTEAIAYMPFPPEKRPKHVRRCICDFGSMNGDAKCHDDPGNNSEGFLGPKRYDSELAFHAAHAAKDPELCGSLELCRGLMGQGMAMAKAHADKIAELGCAGR